MTIFSAYNLSKTYDRDLLFEGISFGMEQGERIGLIGRNGIGKSTLIKILANIEHPDSGEVIFNNNVTFEFLEQNPLFESDARIVDEVMSAKPVLFNLIERHSTLCNVSNSMLSAEHSAELQAITQKIDNLNAWNFENEAKAILSSLGIEDFERTCNNLSGGQRKRVALAKALVSDPDLLIMDEPTDRKSVV